MFFCILQISFYINIAIETSKATQLHFFKSPSGKKGSKLPVFPDQKALSNLTAAPSKTGFYFFLSKIGLTEIISS